MATPFLSRADVPIAETFDRAGFCETGYGRSIPFGCIGQSLLSILYFLPGQAMAPHRHLDSDEYFTAVAGNAEMLVNGQLLRLSEGSTYFRVRGTLHALADAGPNSLVVQSFQVPVPQDASAIWQGTDIWTWSHRDSSCPRCWCGQIESGSCANCGRPCA